MLAWCERANELALSVIAVPELISAFCRLQRQGRLTGAQYQSVKSDLLADIADALVCDSTPQAIAHAVKALESGPLRGTDAIHLGAALACAAEVFISADARQCHVAERFGLRVVVCEGRKSTQRWRNKTKPHCTLNRVRVACGPNGQVHIFEKS